MSWTDGWRLAVGTLTIIPVRPPKTVNRTVAGQAMLLAPLAALPLGVIAAGLGWFAALANWPAPLPGMVVVGALALGTRALHLDGLADTVDGLGSGRPAPQALEIMRRGDIGPMGVVALILVLGAQAVAASALTVRAGDALLLALLVGGSRVSLVLACRTGVPAAHDNGLGHTVAGSVRRSSALVAAAVWVSLLVIAMSWLGYPMWLPIVAVLAAAAVASLLIRLAIRRLGGITGDVLGATVEITLTVLLLAAIT